VGDALLKNNYPAIHAVGRASDRKPRLIDLSWGNAKAKKLTLIGKGVCFDSGGLDLKNPGGMKLMKKDMGGAASVLALAHMVMDAKLNVRLRVLIPAVENSVSGDAYRPLDVIQTRKGLSVEIGNTDAEGRVVLCDALAEADDENPDLIVDFATLTGAARVALGTELPALFCNDDDVAQALLDSGNEVNDPLWRLPLFRAYRRHLDSRVADINNMSSVGQGGAITAALYLQEFISRRQKWMHIDTMAWNSQARPGRPIGGDVQGVRACFDMLARRYGVTE
jgi:leucyl aminopeptidase